MNINMELFRFPLDDPRWKNKAVIGGLLVLLGSFIYPLFLPVYGYAVRVMRQTIEGRQASLPEWDDWGELWLDGLRYFAVILGYLLPVFIIYGCASVIWIPFAFSAEALAAQGRALAEGATFGLFAIYFIAFGIGTILTFPLMFAALVAHTRVVASGSLRSAFEFSEVWQLLRAGIGNYLLAFAVFYGVTMVMSMVATVLIFTIVLLCLYPVAYGLAIMYSAIVQGAVFGMAYRETQSKLLGSGAEAPAV